MFCILFYPHSICEHTGIFLGDCCCREIPYDDSGYTIELDIFEGLFEGTVLAEVEFPTIEAANSYTPPSWFIQDVTNNPDYHNSNMSKKVF